MPCESVELLEDIAEFVCPDSECELLMIWYGYLDDSYDKTQSQFFVCGSYYGVKEQWAPFRIAWNRRLVQDGLAYFKSSECRGLRGEFRRFQSESAYPKPKGREAADRIVADLERIIEEHGIRGFAITMRISDFEEVSAMPETAGRMPLDPYQWVLQSIFLEAAKDMQKVPGNHKIIFGHDDSSNFDLLRKYYRAFREKNLHLAKYMGGFIPLDDKQHPPVQAADMLANLTINHALQHSKNPELEVTRLTGTICSLKVWRKDYMLAQVRNQSAEPMLESKNVSNTQAKTAKGNAE
jgi:hypothetical protein